MKHMILKKEGWVKCDRERERERESASERKRERKEAKNKGVRKKLKAAMSTNLSVYFCYYLHISSTHPFLTLTSVVQRLSR